MAAGTKESQQATTGPKPLWQPEKSLENCVTPEENLSCVFPVCGEEAFLCGEEAFLCGEEAFLCGEETFLCGEEAFLCGEEAFLCGEEAFLCGEEAFLCGEEPSSPVWKRTFPVWNKRTTRTTRIEFCKPEPEDSGVVVDIPHDYTLPINCVSRDSVSAMCFCHVLHLV